MKPERTTQLLQGSSVWITRIARIAWQCQKCKVRGHKDSPKLNGEIDQAVLNPEAHYPHNTRQNLLRTPKKAPAVPV